MKATSTKTAIVIYAVLFVISVSRQFVQCSKSSASQTQKKSVQKKGATTVNANKIPGEARQPFCLEIFGDEVYWTGALQLNNARAGQENAGSGAGLFPIGIRAPGLKQDCPINFLKP